MFIRENKVSNPTLERKKESSCCPVPLGTVVFKTTVIDHSTISPVL